MPNPNNNRVRDGLGYRAVVGVLVPYTNTIAQPEYEAFRPAGVTNHVARMEQTVVGRVTDDPDAMEKYRQRMSRDTGHVKRAMDQVIPAEPHAIVLGHSIATFSSVAKADAVKKDLEEHSRGVPVILPSHAFLAALKTLGVGKRLAAITPYWPPGDEAVAGFFADAGYTITKVLGLRASRSIEIAATPMERVMTALKELAADKPDVIVQPGTNLPTARFSADASDWLGIPVVSCNTATYWHALRELGISDRIEGFGPLFSRH